MECFPLNLNPFSSRNPPSPPFFGGGGALGALPPPHWSHLGLLHVGEWWEVSSQFPPSVPSISSSAPTGKTLGGTAWSDDGGVHCRGSQRGLGGPRRPWGGSRFSSRIFRTMSELCGLWRCPFLSCSQESSSEVIWLLSVSI